MSLAPITEAQRKFVKNDIKMDDEQMQNKVKQLRDWMKKQPHLPQVPGMLVSFLQNYYFRKGRNSNTKVQAFYNEH